MFSPQCQEFFDSPFKTSELRCALSRCIESAVDFDGLPYSFFKVMFSWWQSALVKLFNLVLAWGAVPSLWKRSIVVFIFKQGDPSSPGCCFSGWSRALLKGGSCPHSFSISSPGVHLHGNVQCRFTDQLYTEYLVLVADLPMGVSVPLQIWC